MPQWNRWHMRFNALSDLIAQKCEPKQTKGADMLRPVRNFKPAQALPRMLADFINVHLCMMGALATPLFYLALQHQNDRATTRLSEAMAYYSSSFVLLSPLFPLVFLLNGFYTNSRGYIGRY